MCCTQLAGNAGPKNCPKFPIWAQLCQAISSQLRHVLTIGKKLLSSNVSPTCCHNMVNFSLLVFVWPPYVIGGGIIFLSRGFYLSIFFSSPNAHDTRSRNRRQKTGVGFWRVCHTIWCRIFLAPDSGVG